MIKIDSVSFSCGRTEALRGVDLTLDADRVALLGPNGAGKSTLISLITTVLNLQDGVIIAADHDLSRNKGRAEIRRMIGYVPQTMSLPPSWTCEELLAYACWIHGESNYRSAVARALALIDLTDRRDSKIKTLSGGMRQRLCVAQAIAHQPSVLVVDEPTVGLDPRQRVQLRRTLVGLDCQLLVATHLVDDVAAMADHVAILDGGTVAFTGSIGDLCETEVTAASVEAGYLRYVVDRVDEVPRRPSRSNQWAPTRRGELTVFIAVLLSTLGQSTALWSDRTRTTTLICVFTMPLVVGITALVAQRRIAGLSAVAAASPRGRCHPAIVVGLAGSIWATVIFAVQAVIPLMVRSPTDPLPPTALLPWLQAVVSLIAGAWLGAWWGARVRARAAGPVLALGMFGLVYGANYLPGRLRLSAPFDSPWYVPWIQPAGALRSAMRRSLPPWPSLASEHSQGLAGMDWWQQPCRSASLWAGSQPLQELPMR